MYSYIDTIVDGGVLVEGPIVLYHYKYYRSVLHYDLDDVLNTIYVTMNDMTSFNE